MVLELSPTTQCVHYPGRRSPTSAVPRPAPRTGTARPRQPTTTAHIFLPLRCRSPCPMSCTQGPAVAACPVARRLDTPAPATIASFSASRTLRVPGSGVARARNAVTRGKPQTDRRKKENPGTNNVVQPPSQTRQAKQQTKNGADRDFARAWLSSPPNREAARAGAWS